MIERIKDLILIRLGSQSVDGSVLYIISIDLHISCDHLQKLHLGRNRSALVYNLATGQAALLKRNQTIHICPFYSNQYQKSRRDTICVDYLILITLIITCTANSIDSVNGISTSSVPQQPPDPSPLLHSCSAYVNLTRRF